MLKARLSLFLCGARAGQGCARALVLGGEPHANELNGPVGTLGVGWFVSGHSPRGEHRGNGISRSGSSGGYSYSVVSDWANRPVSYVSYWDACRFANWLHNGQPTGIQGPGTTETGAYTLYGHNGPHGRSIQRNAGAKWAVPSEDEMSGTKPRTTGAARQMRGIGTTRQVAM